MSDRLKAIILVVLAVVCILGALSPWISLQAYKEQSDKIENTVTLAVTWKERVSSGNIFQRHYYLIYGELEDGTPCVLENSDSPQRNKYNGSDFYQQIDIGKVYTFFVTGERNAKYARYPNIIEILEVLP